MDNKERRDKIHALCLSLRTEIAFTPIAGCDWSGVQDAINTIRNAATRNLPDPPAPKHRWEVGCRVRHKKLDRSNGHIVSALGVQWFKIECDMNFKHREDYTVIEPATLEDGDIVEINYGDGTTSLGRITDEGTMICSGIGLYRTSSCVADYPRHQIRVVEKAKWRAEG